MVELAHSWLLRVISGGSGRVGQEHFSAPGEAGTPRAGPAQHCSPSVSSEPEQGQAVQGLGRGGRYAAPPASSDLGRRPDRPVHPRPRTPSSPWGHTRTPDCARHRLTAHTVIRGKYKRTCSWCLARPAALRDGPEAAAITMPRLIEV